MPDRNQSEEQLSAALRELAGSSRQGASPQLGLMLKDSFRRHYARRRRMFRLRIAALTVCMITLGLAFWLRLPSLKSKANGPVVVHMIPPEQVQPPAQISILGKGHPVASGKVFPHSNSSTATNEFVALPSFAMVSAGDELRVVRLEIPAEDLRLMGAPVTEEIANRRVTADFVVGHDGTPYAMRLVNFKENHP